MAASSEERRSHPRVAGGRALRMRAGEAECSVIDISCAGVRFMTAEPPPLMSMVDIRLEIPRTNDPDSDMASFHCQGAVVRTEAFADAAGDREIAIYFTWIDDESRILIHDYVRRQSNPTAAS